MLGGDVAIANTSAVVAQFVARSERLGVKVRRCDGSTLSQAIVASVRDEGCCSAMIADDLGESRPDVEAALRAAGVELIGGQTPAEADPAEAGVSRATFGVAEIGALGVVGHALQPRMATMLPLVHVAVLDATLIYSSLDEAAAHLERAMGSEGVRYASLITGPSRTADVEKTLAVGVHGPRVVHVVLVDGPA
jgi:L-lactate dehydrogenase complex protein LldG